MATECPSGIEPQHPTIRLPDDVQVAICRVLRIIDETVRVLTVRGAEPRICLCPECLRAAADVLGEVHMRYRSDPSAEAPQMAVHRGGRIRLIPTPCVLCAQGRITAPAIMAATEAVDVCRGCHCSSGHTEEGGDGYVQ